MTAYRHHPVDAAARPGQVDEDLLADICRRYYLQDASKIDIARSLGLSRFKVARLLEVARSTGIVHISVAVPSRVDRSLSAELAARLGLDRCVVVDTAGSETQMRQDVAVAAARLLPGLVREGALLGLTWSRAIDAMVTALDTLPWCTAVQLSGSLAAPAGDPTAADVVQRVARVAGGVAHQVHAPLVVDDPAIAAALRRQPGIRDTLQLAARLDVSVVAIGAWRDGCSTVWQAVSPSIRTAGRRAGAVAEVSGRLLGADGAAVISPLDDLVIGASLEQLRRPPVRVALVSGPHRAQAAAAAASAGIVTTLVTTGETAREMLAINDPG